MAKKKSNIDNLMKWKTEHPGESHLTHGAWSQHIRERYSDRRTTEGRELALIMDGLIEDLGGKDQITAKEERLLDFLRAKIIVVLRISTYVDKQKSVITDEGELIPALGKNLLAWIEAAERTLERLFPAGKKKRAKGYHDALKIIEGGNK